MVGEDSESVILNPTPSRPIVLKNFGGIPKEVYSGQAGAAREGTSPDAGDAIRNRDARQAGAVVEGTSPMLVTPSGIVMLVRLVQSRRHIPDAGDAIRDRDARQAGAVGEGVIPDAGDAIRDRDARQAGAVRRRQHPRCW